MSKLEYLHSEVLEAEKEYHLADAEVTKLEKDLDRAKRIRYIASQKLHQLREDRLKKVWRTKSDES